MFKATYQRKTGLKDYEPEPQAVTILGFARADFEPGYWSSGTKKCTVAIIADQSGRLLEAELDSLTLSMPVVGGE